jgi:hypothetical protein
LKAPKGEDAIACEFAQILKYKSLAGELDAVWFYVPNEWNGRNQYCYETPHKAKGKISGVSDYIFMWKGGCGGIELKTPKGTQSSIQKLFEKWCLAHGIPYRIVTSAVEGESVLRSWGILRG